VLSNSATHSTSTPSGDGSLEAASKLEQDIDHFREDTRGTGAGVFEFLASQV